MNAGGARLVEAQSCFLMRRSMVRLKHRVCCSQLRRSHHYLVDSFELASHLLDEH